MKSFKVRVLTPDSQELVIGDAVSVVVPSVPGSFGVLADHEPTVAAVGAGVLRYMDGGGAWRHVVVGEGAVEVSREGMVVLVASARKANDEIHAEELLNHLLHAV